MRLPWGLALVLVGWSLFSACAQTVVLEPSAEQIVEVPVGGQLGSAVHILNNTLLATAPSFQRGAAWVVNFEDPFWALQTPLEPLDGGTELDPDDNQFGADVAYHSDTAVVGSPEDNDFFSQSGAIYIFEREFDTTDWEQTQKLYTEDPREGDQFGFSVAISEDFVCASAPQKTLTFGTEAAGAVYTFRRVERTVDPAQPWELFKVLFANNAQLTDFLGWDISLDGNTLLAGVYGRDSNTDSDVGAAVLWNFRKTETFLFDWFEDREMLYDDSGIQSLVNDRYGQSVSVSGRYAVIGSAGDGNAIENRATGGTAHVFQRGEDDNIWTFFQLLRAPTPISGDRHGFQVQVFERWLTVSAPSDSDNVGVVYGWRFEEDLGAFDLIIALRSETREVGDRFGFAVTLSDAFIITGTPANSDFQGAVWSYNGYEYFPLKPPRFFIPKDGVIGRVLEELQQFDSFLINGSWPVHVQARFKREFTLATLDGNVPNPAVDFPLPDFDGDPAENPAGGFIFLPFEQGNFTISAVAFNDAFNFTSEALQLTVQLWIITPGYYWHVFRFLSPCGSVDRYCPGEFENPFRFGVDLAHYSTPETAPESLRSGQSLCEQDRFCEGGRAFFCGRDYCWPRPTTVLAREARVGERDDDGNDYFNQREFGVSVGDVIEFHFDEVSNEPRVNDTNSINVLMGFSDPIAIEMRGRWVNPALLYVTIIEGSWFDPGMPDLELTRIGVLTTDLKEAGNLRRQNTTTAPARFPFVFNITGTWGSFPAPRILVAEAFGGTLGQNASGPAAGDWLDITFEFPVQTPDVSTEAAINGLILFDPPLENVTLAAEWPEWFVLRIHFTSVTAPFYPNLLDFSQAVGALQVAINPAAQLLARDWSSPVAETGFVTTTGTWGDIPQDLVLSLRDKNHFNVHWIEPITTTGYTTPQYRCQVSQTEDFLDIVREAVFFPNETRTFDRALIPFAYDEEFLWEVAGLATGRTYCTRCAAFNLRSFGPWQASLPACLVVDSPVILGIDRFTTDLTTRGGPVNLQLRNLGFGRHVAALPVNMTFNNTINSYQTVGCQMLWNGSTVTCIAPEGVGRGHRWSMTLFGEVGILSPPDVVTNYKPPVVYDIISEFNNTLTAPSGGNEVMLLTGNNFCCFDDDIFWVRYSPLEHPEVVFEAMCTIHTRHEILRCITGPQAGSNLRFVTNIAGQVSGPVFVDTALPAVSRVDVIFIGDGLRELANGTVGGVVDVRAAGTVPEANATLGLATAGGGVVVLTGNNFGPDRADIPLQVSFRPTRALPAAPAYYATTSGDASNADLNDGPVGEFPDVFVCPVCAVTVPHTEVTCVVPPGYGGLLEWTVEVFGQVSLPYRSNVSYAAPVLEVLQLLQDNTYHLPHDNQDLFAPPKFAFEPVAGLPPHRASRDYATLDPNTFVPTTVDSQHTTDCDPTSDDDMAVLEALLPFLENPTRVDLRIARLAANLTRLRADGYYDDSGALVDGYLGGGMYFMPDGATNAFNTGPTCTAWVEPLVLVSTDAHWVTFAGFNFAANFSEGAEVVPVVDGVRQPAAWARTRDHELVEVLVQPFIGRRRLQLDVNGVRSNGVVLVNAQPVVHGFMEWRLGMEDIRGESPPSEDDWPGDPAIGDGGWGGFGAWDNTEKCMRVSVTGFHYGSEEDMVRGLVRVTVEGRDCELLEVPRHNRLTCCSRFPGGEVRVYVGGQLSQVVSTTPGLDPSPVFTTTGLTRKPIVRSFTPNVTTTAGDENIFVSGDYLLESGDVYYSTETAEALIPTGFEARVNGNYDLRPVFLVAPSPSPLPSPEPTAAEVEATAGARGDTWLSFYPIVDDGVFGGSINSWSNELVVVGAPENHARGHYFRIAVASDADRSQLFTSRVWLPNHDPTVEEVYPPSLPLSGGVINLIGFSFGNGGQVHIEQRLFYDSTSVPGDQAYAGRRAVAHDADGIENRNQFLGRSGGTVGFYSRNLQAEGDQREVRIVSSECLPLTWNHSHIRCLAPPGTDNNSVVVVNVQYGAGRQEGLVYQPAIPCLFNTTFADDFEDVDIATWLEQFRLGLWSGLLVGFALWVAFVLLFVKITRRDPRSLFRPDAVVHKEAPAHKAAPGGVLELANGKRLAGTAMNPALEHGSQLPGMAGWAPEQSLHDDGSFLTASVVTGAGKSAPTFVNEGRGSQRRNTEEIIMAKQVALINSTAEDDELTDFLKTKGLDTGMWKPDPPKDGAGEVEQVLDVVDKEGLATKERKKQERAERRAKAKERRKFMTLPDGRVVPRKRWWQCLCCKYKMPPPPDDGSEPDSDEQDLADLTPRTRARLDASNLMYMKAMGADLENQGGKVEDDGGGEGGEGEGKKTGKRKGKKKVAIADGGEGVAETKAAPRAGAGATSEEEEEEEEEEVDVVASPTRRRRGRKTDSPLGPHGMDGGAGVTLAKDRGVFGMRAGAAPVAKHPALAGVWGSEEDMVTSSDSDNDPL